MSKINMYLYVANMDSIDSVNASYRVIGEYQLDSNVVKIEAYISDVKAEVLGFVASTVGRNTTASMMIHAFRKEWMGDVKKVATTNTFNGRVFAVRKHGDWRVTAVKEVDLGKVIGFQTADVVRRLADLSRTSVVLEHRIAEMKKRFGMPESGNPFYGGRFANAARYFGLAFEEVAANGYTPKAKATVKFESTPEAVNRRYSEGEEPNLDALLRASAARAWYLSRPKMTEDDEKWLDEDVRATIAQAADHEAFLPRKILDRALWIVKWFMDFLAQDAEKKSMMTQVGASSAKTTYAIGDSIDVTAAFVDYSARMTHYTKEGETNYTYSFVLDGGVSAIWKTRVYILNVGHRELSKGDALTIRSKVKEVKIDKKSGEPVVVLTRAKVFRKGEAPAVKTPKAKAPKKTVTKTTKKRTTRKTTKTAKKTVRRSTKTAKTAA